MRRLLRLQSAKSNFREGRKREAWRAFICVVGGGGESEAEGGSRLPNRGIALLYSRGSILHQALAS